MKKMFLFALAFVALAAAPVLNAQSEMAISSSINKVTVYSDRAVIERTGSVDLKAGEQRVIFDSLPAGIDAESIQVRVSSGVILSDLIFQTKYLTAVPDSKIAELTLAKETRESSLLGQNDNITRLKDEKSFLNKIVTKVTTVTEAGETELNPDQWIKMITFYRERLTELDTKIREAEKTIKALKVEIDQITLELQKLAAGRTKESKQALAVLSVKAPSKVSLTLSYVVYGPNWYPVYDLRVDSAKKNLELTYYAYISQNTGEDWSNVNLSLSTAKPYVDGTMPQMDPWYLSLYVANEYAKQSKSKAYAAETAAPQMYNMMQDKDENRAADGLTAGVEYGYTDAVAQAGAVAVVFGVPGATTIASDNNQHKIGITVKNFSASFRYSAIPKLSTYAYLKAKVKNETEFPLLPGSTKIFLDGNFVATGSIPLIAPTEEFWTSLGVDESVDISYKLVKKYDSEEGFIGKKNKTVYEYETVIKNKKAQEIEIVIWDQLPISTDEKIVVKLIDPKYTKDTDALKKNNTDFYEWYFKMKASEETKIKFSYSVEYPLDSSLNGL